MPGRFRAVVCGGLGVGGASRGFVGIGIVV